MFPLNLDAVYTLHLQSYLWIITLVACPCYFFIGPNPSHHTQNLNCLCKNLYKAGLYITTRVQRSSVFFPESHSKGGGTKTFPVIHDTENTGLQSIRPCTRPLGMHNLTYSSQQKRKLGLRGRKSPAQNHTVSKKQH